MKITPSNHEYDDLLSLKINKDNQGRFQHAFNRLDLVVKDFTEEVKSISIKYAEYVSKTSLGLERKAETWEKAAGLTQDWRVFEKSGYYYAQAASHSNSAKNYRISYELLLKEEPSNTYQLVLLSSVKKQTQNQGDSDAYSNAFVQENEAKRRLEKRGWRRLLMTVYKLFAYYGESPVRIFGWALIIVFIFASIFQFVGLSAEDVINEKLVETCQPRGFRTCIYFSVVTFTTLGYGDLAPCAGWGRFYSPVLAVLGLLCSSFWIATIVRKYSR